MITYAVKKTKNPNGIEGVSYYHAQAVKTGELTMEKLAKRINNSTTITQADCYAVLKSMKDHIVEALTEGQVVVLEDLGRFQVSLQGKCYTQEMIQSEEFAPASFIQSHKIVFRPDPGLKKELAKDFKLQRISSEVMK